MCSVYKILISLCAAVFVSLPLFAFAAIGFPFGGRVIASAPCPATGGLLITILPVVGPDINSVFATTVGTPIFPFFESQTIHTGQEILGVDNGVPTISCVPGAPLVHLIEFAGVSTL